MLLSFSQSTHILILLLVANLIWFSCLILLNPQRYFIVSVRMSKAETQSENFLNQMRVKTLKHHILTFILVFEIFKGLKQESPSTF